ncbi:unnamed protein product [Gadus morhua 'NCC']
MAEQQQEQQESLVPGDQVGLHHRRRPSGECPSVQKGEVVFSLCWPAGTGPGMTPDVTTSRRQSLNMGF